MNQEEKNLQEFMQEANKFIEERDVKVSLLIVGDDKEAMNHISGNPNLLISGLKTIMHKTPKLHEMIKFAVMETQYEMEYMKAVEAQKEAMKNATDSEKETVTEVKNEGEDS